MLARIATEIISSNDRLAEVAPNGIRAKRPDIRTGGLYITKILPEHEEPFMRLVRPLMAGLILISTAETPLPGGGIAEASIFGITEGDTSEGRQNPLFFLGNVGRAFLPLLGDNPDFAIHGYHQRLINETNEALEIGLSPYRLQPLKNWGSVVPPAQ